MEAIKFYREEKCVLNDPAYCYPEKFGKKREYVVRYPIYYNSIDECIEALPYCYKEEFLYFININDKYFKLGTSTDIAQRLTAHRSKLGVENIVKVGVLGPIKKAWLIEEELHQTLGKLSKILLNESFSGGVYDTETYGKMWGDNSSFEKFIDNFLWGLQNFYRVNSGMLGIDLEALESGDVDEDSTMGFDFGFDYFNPSMCQGYIWWLDKWTEHKLG